MITKNQFLASVAHEHELCKHCYNQLPDDKIDWAPGDKMRTSLELLRYLTRCGAAPARALLANSWQDVRADADRNASMAATEFGARMDDQLSELKDLLEPVTDEQFLNQDTSLPWGAPCKLGEGLVNTSLKFLTAYRMQLFLYAKIAGRSELGTADCWFGAKAPQAG